MLLSISSFSPAIPIRPCFASLSVPAQQNKLHSSPGSQSSPSFSYASFQERRRHWKIALALDTGGFASNGSQEDDINGDTGSIGQTRLSRILIAGGRQLLGKLNSARRNFPMKVFLLLLGFYTANALATILGQTGDWDVLVAGVVVAAIEGIGMLMYKRPPTSSSSSTGNVFNCIPQLLESRRLLRPFCRCFQIRELKGSDLFVIHYHCSGYGNRRPSCFVLRLAG